MDSGSSTSTSDQSDDPREHEDDILGRVCKENKASRSQVKIFHANVKRRLMQYEGQRISHRHRRILQGILSTHFSNKEKIKAQEFKLKREKDKLKNSEKPKTSELLALPTQSLTKRFKTDANVFMTRHRLG